MKKQPGLVYYSSVRKHFCVFLKKGLYKDLTTGKEFHAAADTVRPVLPEDLYDSNILVEMDTRKKWFYIRVSFVPVKETKTINEFVEIDLDNAGKLIGVRMNYPWLSL